MKPEGDGWWFEAPCGLCSGARWFRRGNFPLGHPDFGQMDACPRCTAVSPEQQLAERVRRGFAAAGFSGVPARTLSDFLPERQPNIDGKKLAVDAKRCVMAWAHGSGPEFLVLVGPSGVGKTHLEEGGVTELVMRGEACRYVIWEDFAHGVQDNLDRVHEFLGTLRDTPWLLIDDVGAAYESQREYLRGRLHEILGHRFQWAKPTMLAGNLAPGEGEDVDSYWRRVFGERFASRMTDRTKVKTVSLWACKDLRRTL